MCNITSVNFTKDGSIYGHFNCGGHCAAAGQQYILHFKVANGTGGEVQLYNNGALIGIVSSSTASTYSLNIGDTFFYIAYPNSGWQFVNVCSSLDGSCDSANPFSATITGAIEDTLTATFSQFTQHHNECQNNVCTTVSGPGTNQCTNVGGQCQPPVQQHNECQNNVCTAVSGPGISRCIIGEPCTSTTNACKTDSQCISWGKGDICLMSSCYRKNDIYVIAGAFALFMLMSNM